MKSDPSNTVTKFELRDIIKDDMEFIYLIANDPLTRAMSFNTNFIEWDEHEKWFNRMLASDNPFYIFMVNGENAGYARFNKCTDFKDCLEVSFALHPSMRGKGYSSILLKMACGKVLSRKPGRSCIGRVKPSNHASQHIFENNLFTRVAADNNTIVYKHT